MKYLSVFDNDSSVIVALKDIFFKRGKHKFGLYIFKRDFL